MILFDSSFLVAYHNTRDVHQPAAADLMDRFLASEWGAGLLLEYVLVEVVTVLAARVDLATATEVGDTLLGAEELEFVPCSDLFVDAYETFRAQDAAGLSFTDAAIVTVARQRAVPHVATFDTDFHGVGGIIVLPEA